MGVEGSRDVGRGASSRYRWLRPRANDKAAFWCLTTGDDGDDGFLGTEFHEFGENKDFRQIPCMQALTGDHCYLCDRNEGDLKRLFALWVWVDGLFHPYPNPDPEGEDWAPFKVDERRMYKEIVGGPMILQMRYGKDGERYQLFLDAYRKHGSFMRHKYKLSRIGGDINTYYELTVLREAKPPEEALEARKSLPTIREVFKEAVDAFLPKQTAAEDLTEEYQEMGEDSPPFDDGQGKLSAAKEPDERVQSPKKRGPGRPTKVAQAVAEEADFEPIDEEQEVGDDLM